MKEERETSDEARLHHSFLILMQSQQVFLFVEQIQPIQQFRKLPLKRGLVLPIRKIKDVVLHHLLRQLVSQLVNLTIYQS